MTCIETLEQFISIFVELHNILFWISINVGLDFVIEMWIFINLGNSSGLYLEIKYVQVLTHFA